MAKIKPKPRIRFSQNAALRPGNAWQKVASVPDNANQTQHRIASTSRHPISMVVHIAQNVGHVQSIALITA